MHTFPHTTSFVVQQVQQSVLQVFCAKNRQTLYTINSLNVQKIATLKIMNKIDFENKNWF